MPVLYASLITFVIGCIVGVRFKILALLKMMTVVGCFIGIWAYGTHVSWQVTLVTIVAGLVGIQPGYFTGAGVRAWIDSPIPLRS